MHSHKDKEPEEFKVVDRRLFTAEGELRSDLPPDAAEPTPPPPRPKPEQSWQEPKAAPDSRTSVAEPATKPAGAEPSQARPGADSAAAGPQPSSAPSGAQESEHPQGHPQDQGPVQFEHLIMSLVSTAMYQLGLAARPGEPPPRPDLPAAQETIDLLALLAVKTKGNLTREEEALLSGSLQELRLAFVELARRAGRIR